MAILTATAALLLAAGPAAAPESRAGASDQDIRVTGQKLTRPREDRPDRVVCKSFQATGSRIHSNQVCKPKKQWEHEELETAMALQRLQSRDGGDENPMTPHAMPK